MLLNVKISVTVPSLTSKNFITRRQVGKHSNNSYGASYTQRKVQRNFVYLVPKKLLI